MHTTILVAAPPPIEALLSVELKNSLWPKEIREDPGITAQAKMRRTLFAELDAVFRQIPHAAMEGTEAIELGKIDPETVARLYGSLADFLDADPYHRRLVLYLPFELIPNVLRLPP